VLRVLIISYFEIWFPFSLIYLEFKLGEDATS